jgi:hypothetical protein
MRKTVKVVKDFRYRTRMLRAGDTLDMPLPDAKVFLRTKLVEEGRPLADVPAPPKRVLEKAGHKDEAPSLAGKRKAELLDIAKAEKVDIGEDATMPEIREAIEAKRAG